MFFDPTSRTWLINTAETSYVLRLTGEDMLTHVYWGPSLTLEQAVTVPAWAPAGVPGFGGMYEGTEELPVDGGVRHGVPSLQVRFADGTRAIEWRYTGHTMEDGELRIGFADRHYPLEISLTYRVRGEVIERAAELLHSGGDDPIEVLRLDSAAWSVPLREDYRLTHVVGEWGAETQARTTRVADGETVLTSRRGITSHHANPWVMVDAGDAGEEHGEVWSAALAWSGSWRITVQRVPSGRLSWTGGFGHDGLSWSLAPGERLETPVFAGLYAPDGFGGASRRWHAYILGHVLPHPGELRPVLYNSWEATGFDVDEEGQRRLAEAAASLGTELFVMDDGWFRGRTGDHAGLGDWTPDPVKFPRGLGPLIAEVHRLGMRFGLWVEPEMVNPDSDLYREHPGWVLHLPHRARTTLRNQLVLNYARPDVAEWAHRRLDRLIADHPIDLLKWDMNRVFTEAGPGDRLWIDHTRSLYAIMDRLRADHPHLRIESCSGGGGRIDLGILSRTDEVWTSDNTDAVDRLAIQYGYGRVYPARAMAAWVTDTPNFLTGRSVPLRFRFHVAMAGVLGIGGDLPAWSDEEIAEASGLVALYKDIRPVVQSGVQHWLRPPGEFAAVQYASGDRVVVFGWRPSARWGQRPPLLRLRGLVPEARYVDEDTGVVHHGAVLLGHGLPVELPPGDHASAVVRLRRL